jgi:hypothetical protein
MPKQTLAMAGMELGFALMVIGEILPQNPNAVSPLFQGSVD